MRTRVDAEAEAVEATEEAEVEDEAVEATTTEMTETMTISETGAGAMREMIEPSMIKGSQEER